MSVNKDVTKRSLALELADGTDSQGNAKTKTVSFPGVKVDAQPEKIMATASAFAGMFKNALVNVYVNEQAALTEQA